MKPKRINASSALASLTVLTLAMSPCTALATITIPANVRGYVNSAKTGFATAHLGTTTTTFNTTGVDKLVVVFCGEPGNNNQVLTITGVSFNGQAMTKAVNDNTRVTATNDCGDVAIYYLDNPPVDLAGTFSFTATSTSGVINGGIASIIGLAGTFPGVGITAKTSTSSPTAASNPFTSITTSAPGSLVIAAVQNSGANNAAGTPTATSPLTQIHNGNWGSSVWGSLATGRQSVPLSGTSLTPTFSTVAGGNIHVIAAEFYDSISIVKADNSDNLNLATSWAGGAVPGNTTFAVWNNTVTSASTTALGADTTFGGIRIEDPAGPVTISAGNTLNLAAIDMNAATQDATLNCDLAMGAGNIWNVAASRTLTVGGAVSGSAGVTKNGSGTVMLSGANTYTGNTLVNGGSMQLGGSYDVAGSGTSSQLQVGSASGTNGTVAIGSGAGTLTFGGNGYANAAMIGTSGGTGALTINGGTVNLAGTAGTTATSLNIGVQLATAAGTGTVTVNNGTLNVGQRILMAANNVASSGTLTIAGGTVNVGSNGTLGYTGQNPGVIIFGSGNGTLNLDGGTLNAYAFKSQGTGTSKINFNGGKLVALGSPAFFLGNNGGADTAPTATGSYNTVVKSGGASIDTNGFDISLPTALVSDPVSTGGGLTKAGLGTLTLSGANTYTGPTLVTGGNLQLNSSAAGAPTTSGITFSGGGTLGFSTGTASTLDLTGKPFSFGGTLALDLGSTGVNDSIVVGDFALTANSALSFTLFGAVANGGTYTVLTSTNPIVAGGFTLTGQTFGKITLTPTVNTNTITVAATVDEGAWNQIGGGNWSTAGNWTGYVPTLAGDAALFGLAIGGPATINIDAPQTVGFMRFDNPNVITLGTGGDNLTFDNGTSPAIVGVNSGSHVIAENIFLASDLIAGPASGTTLTVSGNTSGIKALHLSGAGTLLLAGTNNTHSGGTVINSGTLKLSGTATPGAAGSAVSVSSGGLLDLNGTNQTIRFTAGTGVGTVVNNSGSGTSILTLDGTATINGGLVTVADNTNGSAGKVAVVIAKNTQPMSNANTYSGGTTVNAGAFLYLNFNSPNGAGAGPINLLALGANGAASSGLVVDGATYANDITGAGYVHNNSSAAATVVTTTLTGNLNTSGPFIFRAGTGIVYNFAGNGTTSVLSGVIGSTTSMVNGAVATGSIIKSGTGSLTLSGSSIYTGNTTVSGGTLTFAGSGKIYNGGTNSATVSIATGAQVVASGITNNVLGFAATATWNISGTFNSSGGGAQTLPANVILNNGTLSGVANGTFGTFLGNAAYTVTITANGTSNAINAANFGMGTGNGIALNTPLEADALSISTPLGLTAQAGSLTKAGLGTVTLSGANNYTGTTTITGGTLVITGATQATSAITFSGGRLGLDVSSTVAAASASVNFTDQQVLVSGTPTLASYTLLTTSSMTGTPTLAAPAPAGYELKVESNSLKLVKKAGYATWAATNAPTTGNNPSADEDSDGVSNGVEYVLGGTIATKDLDKLPGISTTPGGDMVFTFKRDQKSIDGSTTAIIELGTTLGAWPDTYPVPDGPVAANPGLTVTQGSPVGFDTVTLVLPRGSDAAKFARLKVTATP